MFCSKFSIMYIRRLQADLNAIYTSKIISLPHIHTEGIDKKKSFQHPDITNEFK